MTQRLTTRGIATATAISKREEFTTSGALKGTSERVGPFHSGILSGDDLDAFRRDMGSITYTVFSYATPIAWYTPLGWYKVKGKFSVTTSKHQGNLYMI